MLSLEQQDFVLTLPPIVGKFFVSVGKNKWVKFWNGDFSDILKLEIRARSPTLVVFEAMPSWVWTVSAWTSVPETLTALGGDTITPVKLRGHREHPQRFGTCQAHFSCFTFPRDFQERYFCLWVNILGGFNVFYCSGCGLSLRILELWSLRLWDLVLLKVILQVI